MHNVKMPQSLMDKVKYHDNDTYGMKNGWYLCLNSLTSTSWDKNIAMNFLKGITATNKYNNKVNCCGILFVVNTENIFQFGKGIADVSWISKFGSTEKERNIRLSMANSNQTM